MTSNTVIRQIDVFDNKTELHVNEIELEVFDLKLMKSEFIIKPDDPLMYDPYEIDPSKTTLFPGVEFDFENYSYYVAAYKK